jgi:hypothetical protein
MKMVPETISNLEILARNDWYMGTRNMVTCIYSSSNHFKGMHFIETREEDGVDNVSEDEFSFP